MNNSMPVSEFEFLEKEPCEDSLPEVKVFVIMPFGNNKEYAGGNDESDCVYNEIIAPGVRRAIHDDEYCLKLTREVDKAITGSITSSIVRSLAIADIVVADMTGRNPNVFLELGIRYALRDKITLLLTQNPDEIPFDIKDYRFVHYSIFKPEKARSEIAEFISQGLNDPHQLDSMVFNVFKDISVIIPGFSESHGVEPSEAKETLRWDEFMNRIEFAKDIFETPMKEGRYAPDALVGISNGGLIVADLLGREAFQGTPILGLWANRRARQTSSTFWFFDNQYNDALCAAIQKSAQEKHPNTPVHLVLVDDHFGSGTTARHATAYLRDRLGEETSIVYFPLVSRRIDYLQVVEDLLPYSHVGTDGRKIFSIVKDEFINRLNTKASYFPYLKKDILSSDS